MGTGASETAWWAQVQTCTQQSERPLGREGQSGQLLRKYRLTSKESARHRRAKQAERTVVGPRRESG